MTISNRKLSEENRGRNMKLKIEREHEDNNQLFISENI
jgi:hypothetical protein